MRIRRVLTAGFAATALVLAGCSSNDDAAVTTTDAPVSSTTEQASESEPESTTAENTTSSSQTEESTTSGQETTESSEAAGSGDITAFAEALTAANASVTSVKGSMTAVVGGEQLLAAEYQSALADGVPTALQMTNTVGGPQPVDMQILLVDGMYYLGGEQMLQQLGVTGGTWVQLDKNSPNPAIAQLATQLETQTQAQGAGQVGALVAVAKSVEEIGTEDVGGIATTHYRLTIDAAEAARLGGASGAESDAAADALGGEVPMDLWLDENGRTVQLIMELDVQGQTMTMTISMSDYDAPVDITAPPADQIAEVPAG